MLTQLGQFVAKRAGADAQTFGRFGFAGGVSQCGHDHLMLVHARCAVQVGGQAAMEPINDNLGFVVSVLETLGGSDELVSLRSKGSSLRPFKKVQELERVAQLRYQAKLDQIERRLEEANAKITDLSKQTGGVTAKGIVITPEMQREIEKFQVEADQLSEERRVIRRGLSEDVNSLGRSLQVMNLLAGPALALLFGLFYTLARRRKTS